MLTGYDELDDIEASWFLYFLTFLFFMIPISEQYRINIKNAIELIDNTLELVERSNVILAPKHLRDIRKEIAKKPYEKLS